MSFVTLTVPDCLSPTADRLARSLANVRDEKHKTLQEKMMPFFIRTRMCGVLFCRSFFDAEFPS